LHDEISQLPERMERMFSSAFTAASRAGYALGDVGNWDEWGTR
jgi:hypothetical protein